MDHGLIERAGVTDSRNGAFFSLVALSLSVLKVYSADSTSSQKNKLHIYTREICIMQHGIPCKQRDITRLHLRLLEEELLYKIIHDFKTRIWFSPEAKRTEAWLRGRKIADKTRPSQPLPCVNRLNNQNCNKLQGRPRNTNARN